MLFTIAKKISQKIKATLRTARRLLVAERTLSHLQAIRDNELGVVAGLLPAEGKLLEIGSGTGWQAQELTNRGYEVMAIDLPDSNYSQSRVFPVQDYDGHTLPFADGAFPIIYSSNLLEHVPHLDDFQKEIHRVLQPGGFVIHVLPSSSWRFWTNITHPIRNLSWPHPHGEHASNAFDEIVRFSRREWCRIFREAGWIVTAQHHNRLFYTGNSVLDSKLSIKTRRRLSRILGSSCNIFVLRKSDCN